MATTDAQNRVYLFRLQVLIIDGGLLVLRNFLDHKLKDKNITLSTCLTHENPIISLLRRNNTITQVQYDLLYPPPGGQQPTVADFDITLIICLLRNLKCCGLKWNFNWNVIPNATDLSVEADIYRLKLYRNQISHISTTTGIKLKDFRFKWTEIEQILLRLNISVPNLQHNIDDIKKSPLDPEAEERIQKEVDKWSKLEKAVEVDLRQVKEDIKLQEGKVKEISKRTSEYTELINATQNKVANFEIDITQVKEDTQSMKDESKLQEGKVEEIYKRTSEHTERIRDTQNKAKQVKEDILSIKKESKIQEGKVVEIYNRTSEHTDLIRDTQNKVADLEKQIDKNKHSTEKRTEQKDLNTQASTATSVQNLPEIIDQYEIDNLRSLKKIYYHGECEEADIVRLLTSKSLECVTVVSSTGQGTGPVQVVRVYMKKIGVLWIHYTYTLVKCHECVIRNNCREKNSGENSRCEFVEYGKFSGKVQSNCGIQNWVLKYQRRMAFVTAHTLNLEKTDAKLPAAFQELNFRTTE